MTNRAWFDTIPSMNKLSKSKRTLILTMLVEGNSMRATARTARVSLNTVAKLLVDAGNACAAHHEETVQNVKARRVQVDEIWSFCYAKARNVERAKSAPGFAGDVWTWTALDSDSKMILAYEVGDRSGWTAMAFLDNLKERLANRVQLTSDGHRVYVEAVEAVFAGDVDYAQLVKLYGQSEGETQTEKRYSPGECIGTKRKRRAGNPDMSKVSTSHVERHNLTMRMSMRRFTRLTNAFSKRIEKHVAMLALYFTYYNFCRIHKSLRTSPAMAAGVTDTLRDVEWIVDLIDAREPKPAKRGPYKKRISN